MNHNEDNALHWQEMLRQEKLAQQGTWSYMRKYERMLQDVETALNEACEDCPNEKGCEAECSAMRRIGEILRGGR